MLFSSLPWISILILCLPAAALFVSLSPARYARSIALIGAVAGLLSSLWLVLLFDPTQGQVQLTEQALWIAPLNIFYRVGIDGFSVLFLPLSLILLIGIIITSWQSVQTFPRLYYSLLLCLETATLGVFCAQDLILFFLFWELTLIPIYFLVVLWGNGQNPHFAALKYTLMMLAGGAALLLGFVILANGYMLEYSVWSFDYAVLSQANLPLETQKWAFYLLLFGFLLKAPAVPFHTWLPRLCMDGPIAIAATMTGLKLGAFGLIRYALVLAPDAAQEASTLILGLGVLGLLYGGMVALTQSNLRLMLAYASISHIGLVLIGVGSLSLSGIQGAVFQLWNFSLISGGLFLLLGLLQQRTQTHQLRALGGLHLTMPRLTTAFFILGVASIGLPGTSGFPAEFLLIMSALKGHAGIGLAVLLSVVLGAAYFLVSYRQAFLGKPAQNQALADLSWQEMSLVITFIALVIVGGFFPQWALNLSKQTAEIWLIRLGQ